MDPFQTTGVPRTGSQDQSPPTRLEVNDFIQNDMFFSLYVQALLAIYNMDQSELLSHFQLGGIHGLPNTSWDQASKPNGGYCLHGTDLFPTWHRPYVALYEQVIQANAVTIAQAYTIDTDSWIQAAQDLRQPYWDWALNIVPPPEIISMDQVTITLADGTRSSVDNPFLSYPFHPIDPSFPGSFAVWPKTLRHPTSVGPSAESDVGALVETLQSSQENVTEATFRLFSITDWGEFSNHTVNGGDGSANSLESIHDGIHNDTGGTGHMGTIPVAGFDPIFFLHHAQVDRILALWSAVHPKAWVPRREIYSDLTPFWDSTVTFWNSYELQEFDEEFNYTYPEFVGVYGSPGDVADAIAQKVRGLYGGGDADAVGEGWEDLALDRGETKMGKLGMGLRERVWAPARAVASYFFKKPSIIVEAGSSNANADQVLDEAYNEWTVRVRCNPYSTTSLSYPKSASNPSSTSLPSSPSFTVYVFLDHIPADPQTWHNSPQTVGKFQAFVNMAPELCANCQRLITDGKEVEGFVHLNRALVRRGVGAGSSEVEGEEIGKGGKLEEGVVKPYLKEKLCWGVKKLDGTLIDLDSLEVVVLVTPLKLEPGAHIPTAGKPEYHHDVTRGKKGGSRTLTGLLGSEVREN